MLTSQYLYLWVMALSVFVPLLRSFESRVAFYKSFGPLFLSNVIVASFFLLWDIAFTRLGYWGFNPKYLSDIYLFDLPLGEWLFFFVVPYCCIFIYRVYRYFVKQDYFKNGVPHINNFLLGFSVAMVVLFYDRWYTATTFGALALLTMYHKAAKLPWLGYFYASYLIILIPFFVVNGILTGTGIAGEIVWYNEAEMIGIRLGTVPFEDAFYGLVLILGICTLYEYFGKQWKQAWAYETETE